MLKLIMFLSVASLLIGGFTYSPKAQANWLEDAVKEKLRREVHKKIRKESRRNGHDRGRRGHDRGRNHQERNRERDHRDRERNRRNRDRSLPVETAIENIRMAKNQCSNYSRTWKSEALCFQNNIPDIRRTISRSMRKERLSQSAYDTLYFMKNKLNHIINFCTERTDTWKKKARCFRRKLQNLVQDSKHQNNRSRRGKGHRRRDR